MNAETEVWAPWEPKVGGRVRVRLSGECQRDGYATDETGMVVPVAGHDHAEEGMTGTIAACPFLASWGVCDDAERGHPHVVRFDRSLCMAGLRGVNAGHFAAVELEPLEVRDV